MTVKLMTIAPWTNSLSVASQQADEVRIDSRKTVAQASVTYVLTVSLRLLLSLLSETRLNGTFSLSRYCFK